MKLIKISFAAALCMLAATQTSAKTETKGTISDDLLKTLKESYKPTPAEKALRNVLASSSINSAALSPDAQNNYDTSFSHRVKSAGITNQKQSGRCWLFTGLNVLRSQMMRDHDLPQLELSQTYNFFFDQLEKSNLFLQGVIDTSKLPYENRTVEWLFQHPLSDGGQFTGVASNLMKYGIVPVEAMRETYSAANTSQLNMLLSRKLREDGLKLRKMAASGASAKALEKEKETMLKDVYRILAISLGEPPASFEWTRKNTKGDVVSRKTYTPQEFYNEFAGNDFIGNYIMLMNDPSRPYYKLYEIDYDRHAYDAPNWLYINLPVDEIKDIAIKSIKDSTMMYFSCDVGKFLDRENGILDEDRFDYEAVTGVSFNMDKAERIKTFDSASSHAMTLVAVDLDENGRPKKWMVENSWGPGANEGHLIMTDKWFDDYMFRLVADKKYVPQNILDILKQKPTLLPAWDPMY